MESLLINRVLDRIADIADHVIQFGITFLDNATMGIAPEELVILGARTGAGKTELLNIIAESASRHARVVFFSLESHELEMEQRALYRQIYERFLPLTPAEKQKICPAGNLTYTAFARGAFNHNAMREFVHPFSGLFEAKYENLKVLYRKSPSAKTIENDILSMQGEADLWILDHLHFLNHESRDELDAVRQAMKLFYELAAKQKTPLLIASHLRKDASSGDFPELSDLHGSSEISKRAVTAILMDQLPPFKFFGGANDIPTLFHIAKFRVSGAVRRYYAVHQFNTVTRKYSDNYVLMSKDEKGEIIVDTGAKPDWARNALSKKQLEERKTLY